MTWIDDVRAWVRDVVDGLFGDDDGGGDPVCVHIGADPHDETYHHAGGARYGGRGRAIEVSPGEDDPEGVVVFPLDRVHRLELADPRDCPWDDHPDTGEDGA